VLAEMKTPIEQRNESQGKELLKSESPSTRPVPRMSSPET
jgi:hypothetical protein